MKIVFLDRDGVINKFPGKGKYVTHVKDFTFIPGSRKAIRELTEHGYQIFVISNQAGVGKGLMTQHKLDQITDKLIKGVEESGGKLRKVYYSTNPSADQCEFRKPNIGSILKALKLVQGKAEDLEHAFFVGDTQTDIQAGHNAGCKTIFVLSGRETRRDLKSWDVQPDYIAENLKEATSIIYAYHSRQKV